MPTYELPPDPQITLMDTRQNIWAYSPDHGYSTQDQEAMPWKELLAQEKILVPETVYGINKIYVYPENPKCNLWDKNNVLWEYSPHLLYGDDIYRSHYYDENSAYVYRQWRHILATYGPFMDTPKEGRSYE